MIYVLDTDILSLLAHEDSPEAPRVHRRIMELPAAHSVVTTIVNYEEQVRGWMAVIARAKNPRQQVLFYSRLLQHLETFRRIAVLPYNESAAEVTAKLTKLRVGAMDVKIASIVLTVNGTLVTRNATDFRKIPELPIEDWSIGE